MVHFKKGYTMNLSFVGGNIVLAGGLIALATGLLVIADVPLGIIPSKLIPTNKKIVRALTYVIACLTAVGIVCCFLGLFVS